MSSQDIETALDNLSAIKNGDDPRASDEPDPSPSDEGTESDWLTVMRAEIDRLYDEHGLSAHLPRDNLHAIVANWQSRNGVCKYNNRPPSGKSRFGKRASMDRAHGHHVIGVATNLEDRQDVIDVVRHEVAHAIAYAKHGSNQNHNHNWKQIALQLGADPSSQHSRDREKDANYYLGCTECGKEYPRQRICKSLKKPVGYACGECGSMLCSYDAGKEMPDAPGTVDIDRLQS